MKGLFCESRAQVAFGPSQASGEGAMWPSASNKPLPPVLVLQNCYKAFLVPAVRPYASAGLAPGFRI